MKTKFDLWLEKVNEERKEHWDKNFSYKPYEPLKLIKVENTSDYGMELLVGDSFLW